MLIVINYWFLVFKLFDNDIKKRKFYEKSFLKKFITYQYCIYTI